MNVWTICLLVATCAFVGVSCFTSRELAELMDVYKNGKQPAVSCHDIPGLQAKVRFCVGVSSFDRKTETMCLRADVTIVKQKKTTEYGAKIGCLKFPKADGQEITNVMDPLGNREAFMVWLMKRLTEEVSQ